MSKKSILILGDIVTLAFLTLIGFATHGETGTSFLPRMAVIFFPAVFAWFALAPWLGLFEEPVTDFPKNLLRIPLAFLFVSPLAVIIRSALLNAPALPLFALIFGGSNALGMMVWRAIYLRIAKYTK